MVLGLLGVSLLTYMLVMNTSWAGAIVVIVFVLPLSLYLDFNGECTLKETFEYKTRLFFRVRKKLKKIKSFCQKNNIPYYI